MNDKYGEQMLKKLPSKCFFWLSKYWKYPWTKVELGDNAAMKLEILGSFCLSFNLSYVYACTYSLNYEKHKTYFIMKKATVSVCYLNAILVKGLCDTTQTS